MLDFFGRPAGGSCADAVTGTELGRRFSFGGDIGGMVALAGDLFWLWMFPKLTDPKRRIDDEVSI